MTSFPNDSKMTKWLINQSINHPKKIITISIVFTILMGFGIQFLIVEDDMTKMLPSEMDSKKTWEAVQNEFGSTEVIFIAFGNAGESSFNTKNLHDLSILTDTLKTSGVVHNITNISTATRIDQVDGFLEISDLQPHRILEDHDIINMKSYLDENIDLKKQLISKKEDYLVTVIQPRKNVSLDVFRNVIVDLTRPILNDYDVHYGGTAYVTGSIPKLIRYDVKFLIMIGLVIMVGILFINLRNLKAVSMILLVIAFSLISMMGFMGWAYYLTGFDCFLFALLNTSMPIILLTIANSDGVHVISKFIREMRKIQNVKDSIRSSMDVLLLPIFLTSITTIAAFLTLLSSPLEPLVGYGLCMSFGIGCAWFFSSLMLPSLISIVHWDINDKSINMEGPFEKILKHMSKLVTNYPRHIFISGIFLLSLGVSGILNVNVDVNVASFFKPGTEIRDSMDFMDEQMSGTMDLRLRVMGDLKDPILLKKIDSLQTYLNENKKVNVSYSIINVIKQMHKTVMDNSSKYKIIPNEREKINNLFTMYSMSGNPEDLSSMIDYDYNTGLITSISSLMSTEEVYLFVEAINKYIDFNFKNSADKLSVTGMIVVIRDMVELLLKSSLFSIFISVIIIGLITALFFKRFIWGVFSIVPLLFAIILNFGLMGHFNITLNHVTAILSSIIIGVGVDFAIHYISQFQRCSNITKNNHLSSEVIKDVGYPIILDASSNMGFGALVFSAFIPVQYIGGLMIFAMLSTSLGTLILLSSSLELFRKHLPAQE